LKYRYPGFEKTATESTARGFRGNSLECLPTDEAVEAR
jgi:hypothetical protein